MRELITKGHICLDDELGFTYRVSEIEYREREDGNFCYIFTPDYSVIDLLPDTLFQGIPGLNLDLRKEQYVRENITPVFISERTPGENREDLWELLQECGMDYLNRLEWLIRTDTRYSGDLMYVNPADADENQIENIELSDLDTRSAGMIQRLLKYICYGNDIYSRELVINDSNRKAFYSLLMALYVKEKKYIRERRTKGIQESAAKGKYKGRDKIQIDDTRLMEVFEEYETDKITGAEAAEKLQISLSTFNRRYKEYIQKKSDE